ncbi:hypothetical protein BDP27DRAFT_1317067 [Rhodocollybia butyracea]|uniref:DUF6699 domain-containing protein n=1 Tax=Rhodocollybia butyracea TaxID=206335 RepID=A0A9P5Q4A1_9AGAR|nr:hypothetical protein BDP27DRAFT_1317067 [Rhodocollybia butyracea]
MSSQVQLHSDLRCQGLYDPPSPCIHWISGNVSPLDLSASATNPPSRQITITVDNPGLEFWMGHWGPIHVSAATGLAYAFLSIEDILGDIYEYFQTPLTPNDLACIPPGRWRGMLEEAKRMRLKASRVIHEGGYVRADLLNGNTRFAGLRWARNHRLVLVTSC